MSREEQLTKSLNEAIEKHSHLYSEDEIRFMKEQLRSIKESKQQFLKEQKNGFGS